MSLDDLEAPRVTDLAPVDGSGLAQSRDDKNGLLSQTLSEAQVDFLLQRTPKREIKYRQGRGGLQFAYVEHGYVTERLNFVFGFNWDFEVVDKQILDDEVIVEARLTVRTPGGQTIVKTQFGGADIKRHSSGPRNGRPLSIADDYKAAASDALKKCASLLGIGLDLYGRDRPDEVAEAQTAANNQDRNRTAEVSAGIAAIEGQSVGLCTPWQMDQITNLCHSSGKRVEELCSTLGVEDLSQLTEARAQRVINRLRQLSTGNAESQAS